MELRENPRDLAPQAQKVLIRESYGQDYTMNLKKGRKLRRRRIKS